MLKVRRMTDSIESVRPGSRVLLRQSRFSGPVLLRRDQIDRQRYVRRRLYAEIGLQANGAVAAVDQAPRHVEQLQELLLAQAAELNIVDLPLYRSKLRKQRVAFVRDFQPNASPVARIRKLVN